MLKLDLSTIPPELLIKLATIGARFIAREFAKTGKTASELTEIAGVRLDETEAKLLADLAELEGGE